MLTEDRVYYSNRGRPTANAIDDEKTHQCLLLNIPWILTYYRSKKCRNDLLAHQQNLLLFWVIDLISLIPAKSTGQPPLSITKHRFPTKSQSTCQYHLCKNLRISCERQKSASVFMSTCSRGRMRPCEARKRSQSTRWQTVVGMLWYKYGWVCFRARMSGQSSSEVIRRWSLIGR
jgi:hypothetical protein